MIIGTTPTHIFEIPFDTYNIEKVDVIYAQDYKQVVKKQTDECSLQGNTIILTLTQEDTLKFDSSKNVQIQVRVLTKDGKSLASYIETVVALRCLNDEVI